MIYWNLSLCKLFLIVLSLQATVLHAYEYVYPVAYANTPYGARVLLIYQDIDGSTSLYTWDPETHVVRKGMPSHYVPAHVTMLPDESGFSFIDNGILRLKKFAKRSARTVEMLDPLYALSSINWIDNHKAYTSAKRRECYEIFEIDCEGTVETIITLDGVNCLYPQKVDDVLFYIESCIKNTHSSRLVRVDYPTIERISLNFNDNDHFDYRVQRIIQNDFERDIYDCHANLNSRVPLCDLGSMQVIGFTMSSENQGVLTTIVEQEEEMGQCACFEINKIKDNQYDLNWLFNFTIPVSSSTSKSFYLYESFVPLLPVLNDDNACVYFSDTNLDGSIALFLYDCSSKKTTQISYSNQKENHFFKTLQTPEGVWYGGSIMSKKGLYTSTPHLWVNEDQMVCLQLPKIESYS